MNNSSTHKTSVLNEQERKSIAAKLKSKDPTLSDKDKIKYQRMSMITTKMTTFFKPKPKKDAQENTLLKSDVTQSSTQQQCTTAESMNTAVLSETGTGKSQGKLQKVLCEGIFPDFRKISDVYDFGSLLKAYGCYRSISANSDYKMGMCGSFYQCFARECNRGGAVIRDAKLPSHFFCVSCFKLYKSARRMKLKQIIKDSAIKIIAVEMACSKKIDLTPIDYKALKDYKNMPRQCMTEAGLLLVRKAESAYRYYENIQKLISSKATSSIKTSNDFVPCKDAFIDQFAKMY